MEREQKDMIVVEMKFAWNTLNWKIALSNHSSSHLLSIMCQSSIYIATNLLNIMVYNTSIIVMQNCETLLCAILVINSWKTATHHSLQY